VDLRFRGPAPDWSGIPRADVVRTGDGQARLRVRSAADIGAVLTATAGRIEILSLNYQPPTLSELFRRAVAA
jgi:hypothetical protein